MNKKECKSKRWPKALISPPLMLSRWRKKYREGTLKGGGQKRVVVETKKQKVSDRELI